MYERFGEMDSYTEINELAENLANEGDKESLLVLGEENGIPEDLTLGYLDGGYPYLCDAETAAVGKIEVEKKAMGLSGLFEDWTGYIEAEIMKDPDFAILVRRKGRSLDGCMARLLKFAFENRKPVPEEIRKAAKISASKVDFGVPGMKEAKRIIRAYYREAADEV